MYIKLDLYLNFLISFDWVPLLPKMQFSSTFFHFMFALFQQLPDSDH